jgi:hypothetical protein
MIEALSYRQGLESRLGDWCETQLCERGESRLEEGGDAWESLGWCWILRNAECRRILRGFWGLLGAWEPLRAEECVGTEGVCALSGARLRFHGGLPAWPDA